MEAPFLLDEPLVHRTTVNATMSSPSSAETMVLLQPPKAPRLPHACLSTRRELYKTEISTLVLSPPPAPHPSAVESELPDIQSLSISGPVVAEQPQTVIVHRYAPPWSCFIYVVPGVKQSEEPCSELEETWGPIAADLGAQLEFASQPAENPSLISDQSIADKAKSLLALIKSRDNLATEGLSGSPSVGIAAFPLILAGYGTGGIVIKLMVLSILREASEVDLGILERISLLVLVETPHRTLDLGDWRDVAKRLFPDTPMNKRNRRIGLALERASRLAECTPGIFQLASGIRGGLDNAHWVYTFTVGLSSRREVVYDHDKSDIIAFIARAIQSPKRPDPRLLRFLQELLTHFDLDNVYWKPPNATETNVWLSTHPEYAAWIEAWSKRSASDGALFLQHDRPSSRRRLTDLVHHLVRDISATRPRSIVARFSFSEQIVKDKHVEAVLAAFAFQILCLQPARFNAVRHMVQCLPRADRRDLETILKEIVAGSSKDPAELTLMVDGLELVAEDGRPLMETLMEIQSSAAVGLLFTQLVQPSRRHPKGEVVVTNFDFLQCPTQLRTGQRADLFSISRFKPSKRQFKSSKRQESTQRATCRYTDPLELRCKRYLMRSSCDSTLNSKDSILQLIPRSPSRLSKGRLGFQRSNAPSPEPEQNRVAFRPADAPSPATGQAKTHRGATQSSTYSEIATPVVVHDPVPPASGPHDKVWGASLASPYISVFQAVLDRRLDESGGRLSLAGNTALGEMLLKADSDGHAILHLLAAHGRIDIMDEIYSRAVFHDNLKTKHDFEAPIQLRQQLVEAYTSSGFNALHIAAQCRHIPAVRRLCQWGVDCSRPIVNSTTLTKQRETALHLACRKSDADMVAELLKLGADVEAWDGNQRGPILVAAEEGSVEILRLLVKHKASLLACGQSSPLHVSAEVGSMELVDEILSLGADQNIVHSKLVAQKDDQRRTPAMLAAKIGHEAVFHRLYKYSRKWEVGKAKNGWGILHFAAMGGNIGILKTILKSGDLISLPGAADVGVNNPLQIAASMGHDKAVRLLLESGGWSMAISALPSAATHGIARRLLTITEIRDRNLDPDIFLKALTNAAKMGLEMMVERLLETYPKIPTVSANLDLSPLIEAAGAGHLDIVRRLVKHEPPADVNLPDGRGRTALLCAAENGHIRVVNYLYRLPATLRDSLDATGRTALVAAAVQGRLDVVMTLASRSFWTTKLVDSALCAAAEAGQVDVVGLLLPIADPFAQRHSLLDAANIQTFTALEHAARQGHADVIRLCLNFMGTISDGSLLEAVAHPACIAELIDSGLLLLHQIDMRDCNGRTALSLAVEHGYYESARLLLEHKANPLAADCHGKTPLHHAAVVSRPPGPGHKPLLKGELVELLLQYLDDDAPTYVRDINGITPLLAAVAAGAVYSVRALLGRDGADGARRRYGHSAFWMAVESGNIEVVLLMLEMLWPRSMGTETLKELVTVAARRNPEMQIVLLLHHGHRVLFCLKNPPDWVTDLVSNDCTGRVVRFLLDLEVEDAVLAREDEHGWRLMDFAYATDMALAQSKTDAEVSRTANQWFRLPTKFETVARLGGAYTELEEGGNLVRSCVTPEMLRYPVAVRADHPIPPLRAFYFEVTIVDEGDDYRQNGIGLATKDTTLAELDEPRSAQRRNLSYFYVGAGDVTKSGNIVGRGRAFRTGDVIGCHVDLSRGVMYFRKNGRGIGLDQRPEFLGVCGRLFPMFYSRSRGVEVRVNFAAGLGDGVQYEREGTRECV